METLIMIAALFAAMYFLMIRPQQKRAKEQQAMREALAEGDRVMLTSGIFATILHLGEKQAIVELAPGNEITVLRQAIMRAADPNEDEFEYDDANDGDDEDVDAAEDPKTVSSSDDESLDADAFFSQEETPAADDTTAQTPQTPEPKASENK